MRKYLQLLLAATLLTGCSFAEAESKKETKSSEAAIEKPLKKNTDVYVPNPQVTEDINLKKAGDSLTDNKGELTLKTVKEVNKTFNVNGIEYIVKDVRLLHFVPAYSLIDFFHAYTHDEEFDFVKINVEVKNNSKENYHFGPVAMVNINDSIHKTWEDDFYLENLNGEISAGQTKRGNLGFIVEDMDSLKKVEILSGDLVDESKKKVADPVKLVVNVN
ncbi:DUF4352 domain-containing protein [Mesobacillus sp. AQ2]|uniref:DUF4352 domain-containing protein n=1 Tax=unclassified Mesobacillus TaxID=2675270 RepID=UPI0020424E00|nr:MULTISPECIES: DUF4352 domain-containing protein [unclassified Mesobacillus]MCM3121968.1 DUF4352 domain-containing protein [Mesobacillus sp. MER 33]MCM3231932.1 DUF4352 domain-containing protein [Mesobacillus sp. MER 48]WHX38892.1 DUF4352 domain-containing protein [Mesobacillus sp. AQ2]